MARCALCESEVPEGWDSCGACGQPVGRPLTAHSGPEAVRKALESARKALAADAGGRVDVAFARALVERSEQTEAVGEYGRALDLARAAHRAISLAKRRTRVDEALVHADVVLQNARQAGIETVAFERNVVHARVLQAKGDYPGAEKILRRSAVRTLDQRREKHLQAVLDHATARVRYAKERGGDVRSAEDLLVDAREALALRGYSKIRPLAAKAIEKAETARKYARAEAILNRAVAEVDSAREASVNITESRKILTQAREALRRGIYADVQKLANRSRQGLREARRYASAESSLRASEREAARERRRGTDVSRAEGILDEGQRALVAREYARVRTLAKDAWHAVRETALLRHVQEAFASLQLDAQDLRKLGADATALDGALLELANALAARDLANARRLVGRARHVGETSREAHYRGVMERTLSIILANATRGLDPETARQLLRQVDDAVSVGQQLDVQAVIDQRLSVMDLKMEASLNERILTNRDHIVKLRRDSVDTLAMEGKLADAAMRVHDGLYTQADGLLDAVEHDLYAAHENLRSEAAESLGRARGEIAHTQDEGILAGNAIVKLHESELAYSEGRYADTVTLSRDAIVAVEAAVKTETETRQRLEKEKSRHYTQRIEVIRTRMAAVRAQIEDLVRDNVDLAEALEGLGLAERAIEKGDLEEAERHVSHSEGIVRGVRKALEQQAHEAVERGRKKLKDARAEGLLTPEMEAALALAEEALLSGQHTKALEATDSLEEAIESKRKERLADEHRIAMEKARAAASKFITVKRLIEDLRKADIDIAGAEEALKAGERALQQKAYDKVDQALADLDATAKELVEELVAAAKALTARANRKINDARGAGIDVDEAVGLLNKAESYFERGDYDDAVEYARAAEKKVVEALKEIEEKETEEKRHAMEAARAEIAAVKRIVSDLGRADISIVNADASLERAEAAFEQGRHADVARELMDTKDMADSLTLGLEAAAKDLVTVVEKEVASAKAEGLPLSRAEMVLANAREAIGDRRFVEAIEYKKVIEDILEDSRKQRTAEAFRGTLTELRARVDAHSNLGADMRLATELLSKAEERIGKGDLKDVEDYIRQVDDSIEVSRRVHLASMVDSLNAIIEEGVTMGLPREELEELKTHAGEAALADDLEEVYRIKGDLQERVLDSKRRSILKKAVAEIQSIDDIVVQSERIGVAVGEPKARLDSARHAIEAGDVEGFQRELARARTTLEEAQGKHFAQRYEARVHSVSTMIANAKRLGAEVGDAERALDDAETALRMNDTAMADVLVKQAEVAIGIQIQNFIKNRYPNLVLHLPTTGLQANAWNQYAFEVENKGKLPARNVEFSFGGDMETKGVTPISEIGVDERRTVQIGLKPAAAGAIPFSVGVSYQRLFDENRYELKDAKEIKVEPEGTYLVEDVFLIHSDGRLICHQSRKFREAIDEDIFSGMLTVVQDFIKDSFRQRTRTGLKRLDFGDSKILIERSPHTFLATVLLGQEPKLLPLYMVQVLKEVEDRYGHVLERWTGMLHQLQGVEDVIAKLILVARDPNADMGALSDSPLTLTAKVIEALGVEQTEEVNRLLTEAQSTLETDIQLSWQFIEQAKTQADSSRAQLEMRMKDLLQAARDTVEQMQSIGVDTSQAALLLTEAEEAFHETKYERVREIHQGLHESLERAKGEIAAKKVEVELASLINDIQIARSQSLDVREAESYLTKIENAIQKRNYRQMDEFLRRAKESLGRQRRRSVLDKARQDLARLQSTLSEAKEVGADLGDVEVMVNRAEAALKAENFKDLEPILERAEATAKARIEEILRERYPRLFLESSNIGLQANRWNRFELRITNKGNWPAENLTPNVMGPVDVQGLKTIESLEPNEKVSLELGLRPHEAGTMDLDFEVHYTRPLDDAKYQVTDTTVVRVEAEGGYIVDDAILIHENGTIVCHESRGYLTPEESSKAAALEAEAEALVTKAFTKTGGSGIKRAQMGDRSVIAARGPHVFLALGVRGQEPGILPLYMMQSLREIQEAYGLRLENWSGDPASLAGIQDLVRKLLFATDASGVSLGPLEDSPVSKIPMLVEKGLLAGVEGQDFLSWARSVIDSSDYAEGFRIIDQVVNATAAPTEEISTQIHQAVLASKEAGGLQLSDEQVAAYVDILRRTLEAAFQAKRRAGIERYWPVARLAIKTTDPMGYDAVSAFRKIIVGQSGAKELDIISPNETWRGMKIEIQVHMDSVSAAYRLWAKKIEILLRSQDSWKIKAGLERGEYSVGIEGQKVRIDPTMVSFVESVPEHVVEEPFDGGVVYLDTRMTKDLLSEGYAREVVNIVRESRKEMKVPEDRVVVVDIIGGDRLRGMLKPWKDLILREANALEVHFSREAPADAYVVETVLGEDSFYLAIRSAEL